MEKIKVFLLGVITAIGLMVLIGASHGQIGRYQVSTFEDGGYVVDTTNGDVCLITKRLHSKFKTFEEAPKSKP